MIRQFTIPVAIILSAFLISGCATNRVTAAKDPYADYDCQKLFKAMEYKVAEANVLFTNYEDEDSSGKAVTGLVAGGAGGGLAAASGAAVAGGTLVLTPLGWVLAGGLMLYGIGEMIDAVDHSELSDDEQRKLRTYESDYNEMRETAIQKKCDYYSIPQWDVGTKDHS